MSLEEGRSDPFGFISSQRPLYGTGMRVDTQTLDLAVCIKSPTAGKPTELVAEWCPGEELQLVGQGL